MDALTSSRIQSAVATDMEGRYPTYNRIEIEAAVEDLWLVIASAAEEMLEGIAEDPLFEARLRENRKEKFS